MTIVVGVATPDGIVLGGDSRSTRLIGQQHRVATDNAIKVFSLCDRLGVATYGDAFIGSNTIAGVMDEFVAQLGNPETITASELANSLTEFFDAAMKDVNKTAPSGQVALGFLVAGYDTDGIGRIFEVTLPPRTIDQRVDTAGGGFVVRGQGDVVNRMIFGFDWDLADEMKMTVDVAVEANLKKMRYRIQYPIALQDAIDFATFVTRTTIDMQRFSRGTEPDPLAIPGCGGPIRLIAVTRHGNEWVSNPPLVYGRPGLAEGA